MKNKWCKTLKYKGQILSSGAARNVRIAECGGMDNILHQVAFDAASAAFNRANESLNHKKLRKVK